ncbi:MAG: peptidylprolyl isomerase [Candidatus Palauibacterales bacterium]|nr:peptidylprolyl isomerase [Candidatus Palauibacterales bacterium]
MTTMNSESAHHGLRLPSLAAAGLPGLLALLVVAVAGCGSGNPAPPSTSPAAAGGADTAGGEAAAAGAADRAGEAGARGGAAPAGADPNAQLVDQVAAVVGDTAILFSEVRNEIFRMQSQGQIEQVPQDPSRRDSLVRAVVGNMVDDMILLQAAQRSGASVPDAQLESAVDEQFQRIQSQFGSQAAFRKAVEETGMNMYQYRQNLRADVRSRLLRQSYLRQERANLPPVAVSEEEIRQFYEQTASQSQRPARFSLRRLVVRPEPDSAAADSARAVAEKALKEIRSGTSFTVAVRRYTDDRATREQGGELGWLQQGDVNQAFARAAWSAPPGRPVGPVRTPLGWHVIEIQNVRGGERNIRHILIRPEITDEDVQEARELARALADSIREGADVRRLAETYGEPGDVEKASEQQVAVNQVQSQLGQAYAEAIGSRPEVGSAVGPFEVSSGGPHPAFAVAKITNYRPAGQVQLSEVREQIRQRLRQQKQFEQLLQRLRDEYYVELRLGGSPVAGS